MVVHVYAAVSRAAHRLASIFILGGFWKFSHDLCWQASRRACLSATTWKAVSKLPTNSSTVLNANGENPKVVQELLRHASLKVTTDVYMQAVGPQKREAQSNLVRRKTAISRNFFILLASPTGFEPVLPP